MNYSQMTDDQLKEAVRAIVTTSESEEEIRRRVKEELKYPYTLSLSVKLPDTQISREARDLGKALGGLTTKSGAMVMLMMHGHDKTIDL